MKLVRNIASTVEVIWADEKDALVQYDSTRSRVIFSQEETHSGWKEYVEPKKFIRYYNIYENGSIIARENRRQADDSAGLYRIARKRVEFVEGEFDD